MLIVVGLTAFGAVGIPIVFLVRGFLMAFSACMFGVLFGASGMVMAAVLFAVPALMVLPVLFLLGCSMLRGARLRLHGTSPAEGGACRPEMILICIGILAVSAAIQWAVVPIVLSQVGLRLAC